jgi:Retrotransposon gag protein
MQGIDKDEQRIMVLISGVEGTVSTWIRQRRMLHPNEDISTLVQALVGRFKDRMKHEKVFLRLTTIRQGEKPVREFNQEFRTVLMDLDQRPIEETLVWYYKVAIR